MNSSLLTILCAGTLALASCGERASDTEAYESDRPMVNASAGRVSGGPQVTEVLRKRAAVIANQIAADLRLDEPISNRVEQIYLNQIIEMRKLEEKYDPRVSSARAELNNNVGVVNSAGTQSATGAPVGTAAPNIEEEKLVVLAETQESMRNILSPAQFDLYSANVARYEPR